MFNNSIIDCFDLMALQCLWLAAPLRNWAKTLAFPGAQRWVGAGACLTNCLWRILRSASNSTCPLDALQLGPIRRNRLIDKNMRQIKSLSMTLSQKWVPLLRVML
jgi:hypothetical protein